MFCPLVAPSFTEICGILWTVQLEDAKSELITVLGFYVIHLIFQGQLMKSI